MTILLQPDVIPWSHLATVHIYRMNASRDWGNKQDGMRDFGDVEANVVKHLGFEGCNQCT